MIGWRGRIGLIVPSCNLVMEHECHQMVPAGVSVHYSRARITSDTPEELERMVRNAPEAAEKLLDGKVNVIAFGCTGASLLKGPGYDREIIHTIESVTDIPATTTSTAVMEALRTIGAKKIAIVTPYEDWLNQKEANFFEAAGFEIIDIKGLGISDPERLARLIPEQAYELALRVESQDADALFISCTDFRTMEILTSLENDLGKPIISSNQATMWMCLKMLGVKESPGSFGSLLTNL